MATSSQDHPTTTDAPGNQDQSGKKQRFWVRLILVSLAILLGLILLLVVLHVFGVPLSPFLAWLGTLLGVIGAFIITTLSDKDFQEAARKRITKYLAGDEDEKKEESSSKNNAAPTTPPNITINISNTNTNTASSSGAVSTTPQTPRPPAPDQNGAVISSSSAIFFVNTPLPNPKEFYGREIERIQLLSRTRQGGCTSIIGARRSGKTWLKSYLLLVAPEQLGPNLIIGSISASSPLIATIAGFTREALRCLKYSSYDLLQNPNLTVLERAVREMVAQGKTPVLCIDEFEGLTAHDEFGLQFFEELRAVTEIGLSLIALSHKPLMDLVSETTRTSPFFNVFLQLSLAPFDRTEAEHFVQEKGEQAQLSEQECSYLLAFGQGEKGVFPPVRLQIAGDMMLTLKRAGSSHYHPDDPEFWQMFRERVDMAYRGMVKV